MWFCPSGSPHLKNFCKWLSDPEAIPSIQFTQQIFIDCTLELLTGGPGERKTRDGQVTLLSLAGAPE